MSIFTKISQPQPDEMKVKIKKNKNKIKAKKTIHSIITQKFDYYVYKSLYIKCENENMYKSQRLRFSNRTEQNIT